MVKVMGNSFERIIIKDLKDMVYYKQIKEYTNQEYETSKDIQHEIQKGKIIIIDENKNIRGSINNDNMVQYNKSQSFNINDLRLMLKELLPELRSNDENVIRNSIRDIAPLIVSLIKQELSQLNINKQEPSEQGINIFQGPEYIPTVSTEGMICNVEAKEMETTANAVEDNLAALRLLKSK
jgi:hypothetical protein